MSSALVMDREAIAVACRAHGVQRLRLFGSATSDRFNPEHSDVDVLVEFVPGTPDPFDAYFGLKEDLERLLDREVDVVMAEAVRNRTSPRRSRPMPRSSMQPESLAYLWDVRAAAVRMTIFTDGLAGESYAADELRKSAVERQLEIIGEALNKLRKANPLTAQRIPDITRIVGPRNILAHGYAVVDDSVIWGAVSDRIPALLIVAEDLLAEIE